MNDVERRKRWQLKLDGDQFASGAESKGVLHMRRKAGFPAIIPVFLESVSHIQVETLMQNMGQSGNRADCA